MSNTDIALIESLSQEHDDSFLSSCFLVAHNQTIRKKVSDEAFVETLITQFKKIVYVKSRPIVIQKIDDLYFQYCCLLH